MQATLSTLNTRLNKARCTIILCILVIQKEGLSNTRARNIFLEMCLSYAYVFLGGWWIKEEDEKD